MLSWKLCSTFSAWYKVLIYQYGTEIDFNQTSLIAIFFGRTSRKTMLLFKGFGSCLNQLRFSKITKGLMGSNFQFLVCEMDRFLKNWGELYGMGPPVDS